MLQKESKIFVIDNSGASKALIIHLYNGFQRRYARPTDLIKVSIKNTRKKSLKLLKVKKGELSKAVVLTTKSLNKRRDGSLFRNRKNSIALISNQNKYLSSKIGIFLDNQTFRGTKFCKLLRMSRAQKKN